MKLDAEEQEQSGYIVHTEQSVISS